MIRAVLTLAALTLLAPVSIPLGTAQAASFDCSKAGTSFEKAICAHPDVSKDDDILAQAYATALGGLTPDATDIVKQAQHDWLDYANRVCGDDGQPIPGTYTDDQAQCLASTFTSRITALEASRMLGGYRFYPVEGYLVEQDTDADSNSFNKVATKHYLTLKIDRTDDVATAFNALTEKILLAEDVQAGGDDDSHLFDKGAHNLAKGDTTADIDVNTTVKTVTTSRITLVTDGFWYGHGAAHGNYFSTYDHFLVDQKRELTAADIFKGKTWQRTLAKIVIAKLKEQLTDGYFPDSEKDMPKLVADPSRWDFSDEGLIVQFQPYEVAAYAAGAVTVTVPWSDLQDDLTDGAQAITSSY